MAPPRIEPPEQATEPCRLPILPDGPISWSDLERVYLERGEALIVCDQARRLALQAHQAERSAIRAWLDEVADDH